MINLRLISLLLVLLSTWVAANPKPNIIVILADDLGYGDISSFGATDIATPRIDQLANEGVKFTQFYSAAPVCTPSRAGLLTGRLSARMGISHVFREDATDGMPPSEITIAEQLKQAGYHTGMVGKWHLGHLDPYMPWNQGFDEFFGVPYSNDMGNFFFYENRQMLHQEIDQRYLTRRYTEKAIDYIERHASEPFFLYLSHNMPHTPLYVSPEFDGVSDRGLYGDVVQELDWSTGQIVDKLIALDLLENTLIIFSSDNGPWLAMRSHGGSAGQLRDGKGSTFEGGQKVPALAYWPARITSGRVEVKPSSLLDLMPTFSAIVNVPLPEDRVIDGRNISALISRKPEDDTSSEQFFYISAIKPQINAYRQDEWKLKLARKGYPKIFEPFIKLDHYAHKLMLFNLKDDPFEANNIATDHPERVKAMQTAISQMEQSIASEGARPLKMSGTKADRKGYGEWVVRLAMLAFILLGLLYALYRVGKFIYRRVFGTRKIVKSGD
ncbi:MAG: arylsulfatase A [Pseudomonadales bacterium]